MNLRDAFATSLVLTADAKAMVQTTAPTGLTGTQWSWHYSSSPPAATRVRCDGSRTMGMSMVMEVLRRIEWTSVRGKSRGQSFEITFTPDTYLCSFVSKSGGHIEGSDSHPLWRLEADVDMGFLSIYGLQLREGGWKPLEDTLRKAIVAEKHFFKWPIPQWMETGSDQMICPTGGKTTAIACAPVILVGVSLAGCKERRDFEPFRVASACRLYPQLYLFSTVELTDTTAQLGYGRAQSSPMGYHGSDMSNAYHGSLYTDRNSGVIHFAFANLKNLLLPKWDALFDYYEHDADFEFEAVKAVSAGERSDGENRRVLQITDPAAIYGTRPRIDLGLGTTNPSDPRRAPVTGFIHRKTKVTKLGRQGAFDNLHIAPRMKVNLGDPVIREVEMAPICQHDCLHTHWRWGLAYGTVAKHTLGWSHNGPHSKAGAAMVPPGQSVHIRARRAYPGAGGPGLTYMAQIARIAPMSLEVVNHHGAAYVVNLMPDVEYDKVDLAELPAIEAIDGAFYYDLQYELFQRSARDERAISVRRLIFENLEALKKL